jgi:hypothetical protein
MMTAVDCTGFSGGQVKNRKCLVVNTLSDIQDCSSTEKHQWLKPANCQRLVYFLAAVKLLHGNWHTVLKARVDEPKEFFIQTTYKKRYDQNKLKL